jgi:MFS family permease
VIERRAAEPVVPVHLFSLRTFTISTSVSFILGVAMFGAISFIPLFLQVVHRATATNSGLQLLPLLLGLLVASVGSGQVITRTGHYKVFPIVGTGLATVAMILLSTMGAETAETTVITYMVILGAGIGFSMQTLVLATQNVVPTRDLGAATSSVSFFRSMGGSIGVALFGALFNSALSARLAGIDVSVTESSNFTPDVLRDLPPGQRTEVVTAFAESLTGVFLYAAPLVAVAFALSWLLHETPLRTTRHFADVAAATETGSTETSSVHHSIAATSTTHPGHQARAPTTPADWRSSGPIPLAPPTRK